MKDLECLEIHVSNLCNRRCSFCVSQNEDRTSKMSMETAREILETYNPKAITFSGGGEPTTNMKALRFLIEGFTERGSKCGLTTNGYKVAPMGVTLEWVRLSVYEPRCEREISNVLMTKAKMHNAALFFKGLKDLEQYTYLTSLFDEVTVKTLNGEKPLGEDECKAIRDMGFLYKQNPVANDFSECLFAKPAIDPSGKVHKCCLCKAKGGFSGVEKCIVPCVMYQSNKAGHLVLNKYRFPI